MCNSSILVVLSSKFVQHWLRCCRTSAVALSASCSLLGTSASLARWYTGPEGPDVLTSTPASRIAPVTMFVNLIDMRPSIIFLVDHNRPITGATRLNKGVQSREQVLANSVQHPGQSEFQRVERQKCEKERKRGKRFFQRFSCPPLI